MRIAGYTSHALQSEVEGFAFEACFFKKWYKEGAEAAIYVKRYSLAESKAREGGYVIDDAVREVRCRADKEDGV